MGEHISMTINLVTPDLSHWGPITTELFEAGRWPSRVSPELLDELVAFYDAMLIPEMVCAEAGPDRPSKEWMNAEGRKIVVARDENGVVRGCWIIKEGGIYYPCVNVTKGVPGAVPILRALAYKSWEEEGSSLYADTSNTLIHRWVNLATSTPEVGRPDGMPLVSFSGDGTRVEWK